MASINEVFGRLGIIHGSECTVCEVAEPPRKYKGFTRVNALGWIDRIVITTLTFGVGYLIGMALAWQPLPLERINQGYNHIKIYEDGSYEGETRKGQYERGCILSAPCND